MGSCSIGGPCSLGNQHAGAQPVLGAACTVLLTCAARTSPPLAAASFINVMTCDFLCLCALAPFW